MSTTYYNETAIRTTARGSTCYTYRYAEDFGRERGYARSWGCREARGRGMIWAKPGESFDDAIARRRCEYSEV